MKKKLPHTCKLLMLIPLLALSVGLGSAQADRTTDNLVRNVEVLSLDLLNSYQSDLRSQGLRPSQGVHFQLESVLTQLAQTAVNMAYYHRSGATQTATYQAVQNIITIIKVANQFTGRADLSFSVRSRFQHTYIAIMTLEQHLGTTPYVRGKTLRKIPLQLEQQHFGNRYPTGVVTRRRR